MRNTAGTWKATLGYAFVNQTSEFSEFTSTPDVVLSGTVCGLPKFNAEYAGGLEEGQLWRSGDIRQEQTAPPLG